MGEVETIRVLIADDHTMVRTGLATFLGAYQGMQLVGQAANGQEAVNLCAALQPDVVLMDLVMPEMNGVEATEHILRSNPDIRVIALTSFKDDEMVYAALKAGAVNYLLKDVSTEELAQAIQDAYAGKATVTSEVAQALLRMAEKPTLRRYQLSERELDVLRLMVRGMSNHLIAKELFLGQSTVKFHVSNILSKLGVSTRTEAVALAVQHKLID